MADDTRPISPYRDAESIYESEELFTYLYNHRFDDLSLCLGYYLCRAERRYNLNQSDVAALTQSGRPGGSPITRSALSQVLSGKSSLRPETIVRLCDVLDANPIDFYRSLGWVSLDNLTSYSIVTASADEGSEINLKTVQSSIEWTRIVKIVQRLFLLPPKVRSRTVALFVEIIDNILTSIKRSKLGIYDDNDDEEDE